MAGQAVRQQGCAIALVCGKRAVLTAGLRARTSLEGSCVSKPDCLVLREDR